MFDHFFYSANVPNIMYDTFSIFRIFMTLILTVATGYNIFQVSDRRLTRPDGTIVDDEANKAICVTCQNAHFTITYTGLAEMGSTRTDIWIVDRLAAMQAGEKGLESIAQALKTELSEAIRNLPYDHKYKGLTLVFSGFNNNKLPFIGFVSNQKDSTLKSLHYPAHSFQKAAIHPGLGAKCKTYLLIRMEGATAAVERPISRRINKLKTQGFFHQSDRENIRYELVSLVRSAARTAAAGKFIGKNCMSTVSAASPPEFRTMYHPSEKSPYSYAPHIVSPRGVISKFQVFSGSQPPPNWDKFD